MGLGRRSCPCLVLVWMDLQSDPDWVESNIELYARWPNLGTNLAFPTMARLAHRCNDTPGSDRVSKGWHRIG